MAQKQKAQQTHKNRNEAIQILANKYIYRVSDMQ